MLPTDPNPIDLARRTSEGASARGNHLAVLSSSAAART